MRVEFAGDTHVGTKREHNEDSLLIMPEFNLFVVADGMGGHTSGEVASKLAIETIRSFYVDTSQDEDITWPFKTGKEDDYHANRLVTAIKLGNQRIFEASSSNANLRGMGTTAVSAYYANSVLYVAHVGDSRCYSFFDGKLSAITEDHSLLNDFRRSLSLTPEEERKFPHKNIIVRALGMKGTVDVDIRNIAPRPGETFLLCSDGLTGEVDDSVVEQVLREESSLVKACHRLVQLANDNGGRDNVTVILLRVVAGDQPGIDELTAEVTREITEDLNAEAKKKDS
jgi:protein phosphatase